MCQLLVISPLSKIDEIRVIALYRNIVYGGAGSKSCYPFFSTRNMQEETRLSKFTKRKIRVLRCYVKFQDRYFCFCQYEESEKAKIKFSGQKFLFDTKELKKKNEPKNVMRVVNIKDSPKKQHDVFIGRPGLFGNPFSFQAKAKAKYLVKDRKEALESYEKWVKNQGNILVLLYKLKNDSILGCFCKPLACHGDILIKLYNEKFENIRKQKQEKSLLLTKALHYEKEQFQKAAEIFMQVYNLELKLASFYILIGKTSDAYSHHTSALTCAKNAKEYRTVALLLQKLFTVYGENQPYKKQLEAFQMKLNN